MLGPSFLWCDMESDGNLNPDTDDLPLRANTNHILVRHYVLDLTVDFDSRVINGSIVLFLEPRYGGGTKDADGPAIEEGTKDVENESRFQEARIMEEGATEVKKEEMYGAKKRNKSDLKATCEPQIASVLSNTQSSHLLQTTSGRDFTLVLDCCDLDVSKVEEVDVASVSAASGLQPHVASEQSEVVSAYKQASFVQRVISMPSAQWEQKNRLFSLCSRAPGAEDGSSLRFHTDSWSLQVRKTGVSSPEGFPRVIRICYKTRMSGGSVRWTKDQDDRVCVYTAGSPINNRALFPCQEPPVAMSTWQATVRAPSRCVVLMSGEKQAVPTEDGDSHFRIWNYYVTMPMPASTFTLAVGHWRQVTMESPPASEKYPWDRPFCGKLDQLRADRGECTAAELVSPLGSSSTEVGKDFPLQTGRTGNKEGFGALQRITSVWVGQGWAGVSLSNSREFAFPFIIHNCSEETTGSEYAFCHSFLRDKELSLTDYSGMVDDSISCSHGDYPCRFTQWSAWSQRVIPHRVFSPACLLQEAQTGVLSLLPRCLAAAHAVLGVHPFPRLDVVIVPAGFSSLGMAR
ncbi:unnamed protein product [Menidia menidia]|uniref:(Atlantic silverside) hypothetical protein n=1 Tax=Menidia menidia TaxID=238744 RepID=A0A8S4B6W7_9TELE|nr:unnamed protein product [Menidia menidia]